MLAHAAACLLVACLVGCRSAHSDSSPLRSGDVPEQTKAFELDPLPDFTEEQRRRLPATVDVLFVVERDGSVELARVQSSSDPLFDDAALEVVRSWRFAPGKRDGEPVRVRMRAPFRFRAD